MAYWPLMRKRSSRCRAEILRAAAANPEMSHAEIAGRVRCHESTVAKHLKGRSRRRGRRPLRGDATLPTRTSDLGVRRSMAAAGNPGTRLAPSNSGSRSSSLGSSPSVGASDAERGLAAESPWRQTVNVPEVTVASDGLHNLRCARCGYMASGRLYPQAREYFDQHQCQDQG